jgi:hypothetical protein
MTLLKDLIKMLMELGQDQSSSYSSGGMMTTLLGCLGGNLSLLHDNVPIYKRDLGQGQAWEHPFLGGGVVDDIDDGKPAARYLAMECA